MASASSSYSATTAPESFSGPYGPGAQHTGWDGAMLELHSDGRFILELWRFWEQWGYLPEDKGEPSVTGPSGVTGVASPEEAHDAATRAAVTKFSNGGGGLRVREVEEVRVVFEGTAKGRLQRQEAPAVKLSGFEREELNQVYMEDASKEVSGKPTWWSTDGRYFLYFVEENQHWKVNSVRISGGDGLNKILPGARRAGRGYAHSGPVEAGQDPSSPLRSRDGWFECVENEWEPAEIRPIVLPGSELTFCADRVTVDERHMRGEEGTQEKHVAPELSFRGWRHTPGGEVRIALPPIPDRHVEGEDMQLVDGPPPEAQASCNFLGDPDVVILRPTAKL